MNSDPVKIVAVICLTFMFVITALNGINGVVHAGIFTLLGLVLGYEVKTWGGGHPRSPTPTSS